MGTDKSKYPKSAVANPVCKACHWYSCRTHTCDYFLQTGQRKSGAGKDCNAYKPRNGKAKRFITYP